MRGSYLVLNFRLYKDLLKLKFNAIQLFHKSILDHNIRKIVILNLLEIEIYFIFVVNE